MTRLVVFPTEHALAKATKAGRSWKNLSASPRVGHDHKSCASWHHDPCMGQRRRLANRQHDSSHERTCAKAKVPTPSRGPKVKRAFEHFRSLHSGSPTATTFQRVGEKSRIVHNEHFDCRHEHLLGTVNKQIVPGRHILVSTIPKKTKPVSCPWLKRNFRSAHILYCNNTPKSGREVPHSFIRAQIVEA